MLEMSGGRVKTMAVINPATSANVLIWLEVRPKSRMTSCDDSPRRPKNLELKQCEEDLEMYWQN